VIWEGYLAIDTRMWKSWISLWNLIFNFRGQNISLEHSRLTSPCFPVINISDYTCLIIGRVDHIDCCILLTNLTTIDLFEWGQIIKGIPDILKENWGPEALVSFKISHVKWGRYVVYDWFWENRSAKSLWTHYHYYFW